MRQFKQFQILGHTFDPQTLKAKFSYSFDSSSKGDNEVNFTETIDFSRSGFAPIKNRDQQITDNLLFHLSIALGISYYKLYPTASIVIQSGALNENQIFFWKQFYINGLGEFFFKNNLKPFAPEFISTGASTGGLEPAPIKSGTFGLSTNKALIPLGGGKDSLVSVELIKKACPGTGCGVEIPFHTCTFGKDNPLYKKVNDIIGTPRLFISRKLDSLLFKMNAEGYYNGHVPISGIIAFALTVVAYLYDYKYLILSNEKSANEGNTEVNGVIVNHQRSKSLEFEKAFDNYVHHYISSDLKYFSLLRGMYEIKIAQEFASYQQYFSAFSSCNRNFHILTGGPSTLGPDGLRWCCKCPKCAFVYAILRPRLTHEQTLQIFGKELYEDASLESLFKELLGLSGIKPFECVGTNEEMILAMWKFHEKSLTGGPEPAPIKSGTFELRPIMKLFQSEILPRMSNQDFLALEKKLMKIYNEDNIPQEIKKILPK